jgi:antitoxin protein of toxin-antitoxin system
MDVPGNGRDWSGMGISDRINELTRRAESTAAEHKDQIRDAVEKAEVTADQRTGGKYHDQIADAAAKAKAYVEKLEPDASEEPPASSEQPPADGPPPGPAA